MLPADQCLHCLRLALENAVAVEREACAKVADAWAMWPGWCDVAKDIAHEIRRRADA
jgi:hypothetical protein